MSRIQLATDLKTRTGVPDKDARLKNAYVEGRGDPQSPDYQTIVRKRPIAQGGVAVGTGTAQGGIGFNIGSTPYFIGFWSDTLVNYTGGGTTWNSGAGYVVGDHVTENFVDYWANNDNTNSQPPNSNWSTSFVPSIIRYSVAAAPAGNLSYNGNINFTYKPNFPAHPSEYLNATQINGLVMSSAHSSATFNGLITLVKTNLYSSTPNVTGNYSGQMWDQGAGPPSYVSVTGTWSSPTNLENGSWDSNPLYEIDGTLQNVISTSCTRTDLIPNSTVIGNMGAQGKFSSWEGSFLTHP